MLEASYNPEFNFVGKSQPERGVALGVEYDMLLKEREELETELENYDYADYSACLVEHLVGKEKIKEIAEIWLARVRAESKFLDVPDRLRIRVFAERLEKQPCLRGEQITFGSRLLRNKNTVALAVDGDSPRQAEAFIREPTIRIHEQKPSLAGQLSFLLAHEDIMPAVEALLHEIIHRKHFRRNPDTELLLTEAQAHWHGLLRSGRKNDYSISTLGNEVRSSLRVTDTPPQKVEGALKAVYRLYAYGYGAEQVAQLVTTSAYNTEHKRWVPLEDQVELHRQKHGLSHLDTQALQDLWRLRATNELKKARLLLFKSIANTIPYSTRQELKEKFLSMRIFGCNIYTGGKEESSSDGNVIYPQSAEFFNNKKERNGLFFGNVPKGLTGDQKPQFTIGYYAEQVGKMSAVHGVNNPSQQEQLLALLSEFSTGLPTSEKKRMLAEAIDEWPLFKHPELTAKILLALITQREAREIFNGEYLREYEILKEQEAKLNISKEGEKPGHIHRDAANRLKRLKAIADIFNIKLK